MGVWRESSQGLYALLMDDSSQWRGRRGGGGRGVAGDVEERGVGGAV